MSWEDNSWVRQMSVSVVVVEGCRGWNESCIGFYEDVGVESHVSCQTGSKREEEEQGIKCRERPVAEGGVC